jgi:hypothetical protein
MAEPAETGTTEETFRCPTCGMMFPTGGADEGDCPADGTHCTREKCEVLNSSNEDF